LNRTSAYLATLNGVICVLFLINLFFFAQARSLRNDLLQGILIGGGLAFVTAQIYARLKATKVNGWITMFGLGQPNNSVLLLERVLVEDDNDVATAYEHSKQFRLTTFSSGQTG
jgi:hypothetical protein